MRVVVFGASGTIGRALLPQLQAAGHDVVPGSRKPREGWGAADVTDGEAVGRALEGADVAVYLVHSLGMADFEERDRRAARTVAEQAETAGLAQIVYLGGLGDDAEVLSKHLRSRRETERELASGSVPVTTLRAAMVVGPGSAAFETIRALVDRLPVMVMPRWGRTETQPVAIEDVARFRAGVCGVEEAYGRAFDVGGPEVMTYREMVERIARIRGRRPLIVEVPALTPRLSSLWLYLVTPVSASVARPLVEGLRNPTTVRDGGVIRELVAFEPTPFDEAVRTALTVRKGQ